MIHAITANQPSFHPVRFTTGLNVILADRAEGSSSKDTRNGLGKSTLIEIIHFCLGARATKGRGLAIPVLKDWAFTMEITLAGNRVNVTRAVDAPTRIVVEGPTVGWPNTPDPNLTGESAFNLHEWTDLLGKVLFSLPPPGASKRKPSFRSLVSYFIRRGHDAFSNPFTHTARQQSWDWQLHVALLLGLEWQHAADWQDVKDRLKTLRAFRQAVDEGATAYARGSIGEMEAERVTLEQEIERESRALRNFKVLPQYESVQQEADRATEVLHAATNANIVDRRRLKLYYNAVQAERPPSNGTVEAVYEEMGVVFAENGRRTLAEAREFYTEVVKDRHRFLSSEISRLERGIAERNQEIADRTEARAELLQMLKTHGALEEMNALQERHTAARQRLERVATLILERRELEANMRRITREMADLAELTAHDHEQRRDIWSEPVRHFNRNSQALYRAAGHLAIDSGNGGFRFNIEISRSGSEGIGKMKIFCFDLALLEFSAGHGLPIDFLVHDSELYDGVDSRQRAAALERAHEVSEATGTQYICALNSDMIPRDDFSRGFDFDERVRLTLTDKEPAGSLLGFNFDPPPKS